MGQRRVVTLLVIDVIHASPHDAQEPVRIQSPIVIDDKSDFPSLRPHFSYRTACTVLYLRETGVYIRKSKINLATLRSLLFVATTTYLLLFQTIFKSHWNINENENIQRSLFFERLLLNYQLFLQNMSNKYTYIYIYSNN